LRLPLSLSRKACWQQLEADLDDVLRRYFPGTPLDFEIHGSELRTARSHFKLRDDWLKVAQKHQLKLVYRAIVKKRFEHWVHSGAEDLSSTPLIQLNIVSSSARR
jgi:hypothetical protein